MEEMLFYSDGMSNTKIQQGREFHHVDETQKAQPKIELGMEACAETGGDGGA